MSSGGMMCPEYLVINAILGGLLNDTQGIIGGSGQAEMACTAGLAVEEKEVVCLTIDRIIEIRKKWKDVLELFQDRKDEL